MDTNWMITQVRFSGNLIL